MSPRRSQEAQNEAQQAAQNSGEILKSGAKTRSTRAQAHAQRVCLVRRIGDGGVSTNKGFARRPQELQAWEE